MAMAKPAAGLAVIIMGVSGSGKSTIGQLLAKAFGCPFIDADDFHSIENKEKMRRGVPLNDADRIPWLETLRDALIDYIIRGELVILACSALQPAYRNIIRTADYEFMLQMHERDPTMTFEERNSEEREQNQQLGAVSCSQKVRFFLLNGPIELFASRLERRHMDASDFMSPTLLQSQMDTLNITEEEGIIFVDARLSPDAIVEQIRSCLCASEPSMAPL